MGDYCKKCGERRQCVNVKNILNIIDNNEEYYGFICKECCDEIVTTY